MKRDGIGHLVYIVSASNCDTVADLDWLLEVHVVSWLIEIHGGDLLVVDQARVRLLAALLALALESLLLLLLVWVAALFRNAALFIPRIVHFFELPLEQVPLVLFSWVARASRRVFILILVTLIFSPVVFLSRGLRKTGVWWVLCIVCFVRWVVFEHCSALLL